LKIDAAWAGGQLEKLASRGILEPASKCDGEPADSVARGSVAGGAGGGFCYAPRSPELDASVAAVADAYAVRRVSVIGLIFSKPTSNLKSFADAFRIRKDNPDG
jgi:hypothetical protein